MKTASSYTPKNVVAELRRHADKKNVAGMARFGINPKNTLGISIPFLRLFAKRIGTNHKLALAVWKTGIHEARILSAYIDDPKKVTRAQMDSWVKDFDSWDVCDQVTCFLFDKTSYAYAKAVEWSRRPEEFVKRAGFSLMAGLAWHDSTAQDGKFLPLLTSIKTQASDERNFVKKAISWALRHIGKRNTALGKKAVIVARQLSRAPQPAARWVGNDALREFKAKGIAT